MKSLILGTILVGWASSVAGQSAPGATSDWVGGPRTGVLVMAHGGTAEWNASVDRSVAPLRAAGPTTVAFGMADPMTMQAALDSLADAGVERVAVVRMFMSGESFRHQTEYLLGLRDDPPANPMLMHGQDHGQASSQGHGQTMADHHASESAGLHPLRHDLEIVMSEHGLMDSWVSPAIMKARAEGLAELPAQESVILVAHGMGDDAANQRVLNEMARAVQEVESLGFRTVRAFTLREDWEDARVESEVEIRSAVEMWQARGDRVLALPFRLSGFGPYAEVLSGMTYEAGDGLLPHPFITEWIRETAALLLNQAATAG